MLFLQARNQIRTADVTSTVDQILALLPKAMTLIGALLLVVLVVRAARAWKTLSVTEMAAIVIAFALVSRG